MSIQFKIDDLYKDINIDISKICKDTDIKLNTSLQKYKDINIKQLFSNLKFDDLPDEYYNYTTVKESSLNKLSDRLYGNSTYWWIILLVNKIDNPICFNMSPRMITILANYLYRYEGKYTEDVYFDLINEYNETKKEIRYIKKDHLNEFFRKLQK
jgi:hypothetical protein